MEDKTEGEKGAEEDGKGRLHTQSNAAQEATGKAQEEGPRYHLSSLTPLPASQETGTFDQSGKGLPPSSPVLRDLGIPSQVQEMISAQHGTQGWQCYRRTGLGVAEAEKARGSTEKAEAAPWGEVTCLHLVLPSSLLDHQFPTSLRLPPTHREAWWL